MVSADQPVAFDSLNWPIMTSRDEQLSRTCLVNATGTLDAEPCWNDRAVPSTQSGFETGFRVTVFAADGVDRAARCIRNAMQQLCTGVHSKTHATALHRVARALFLCKLF